MASWVLKQRPSGEFDLVPKDELNAWLEKYQPKSKRKFAMPKKVERGSWVIDRVTGKLVRKSGQVIQFGRGLQIVKDIEPFRNVAIDRNEIIGGRKQKRDMMRARNVIECGDVKASDFKKPYDPKKHQLSVVESLKKTFHQYGMGD